MQICMGWLIVIGNRFNCYYIFVCFRYVIVYFAIMYIRHHEGIVTDEMLHVPKTPFIVLGLLQALAAAAGNAAGGNSAYFLSILLSMSHQIHLSIDFTRSDTNEMALIGAYSVHFLVD